MRTRAAVLLGVAHAWHPAVQGACTRQRRSRDAVVWLGQRKHSSYDASHGNTLNASLASVVTHYRAIRAADVLIWHEGDLSHSDVDSPAEVNVRFCRLAPRTGWGRGRGQDRIRPRETRWSEGYMRMIRFYAVTGWDTLRHLGYEWWMRMDDDSFFLSNIDYNVFDAMRGGGYVYGFRALSRECDRMFGAFVDVYREDHGLPPLLDDGTIFCERVPKHCSRDGRPLRRQTRRAASRRRGARPEIRWPRRFRARPYCEGPGRVGFYNNWFVSSIEWWTSEPVSKFRRAFDASALIFSHRHNDLIFQSAAVRLLLARERWRRFADFSYQHHTVRDGRVTWGGLETGYDDPDAKRTVTDYLRRWHAHNPVSSKKCRVQLTRNDSRFYDVAYVPHGRTRWGVPAAPYCPKAGRAPLW